MNATFILVDTTPLSFFFLSSSRIQLSFTQTIYLLDANSLLTAVIIAPQMQLFILNQLFILITQKKISKMTHFAFLFSIHLSKPVFPHWEDPYIYWSTFSFLSESN